MSSSEIPYDLLGSALTHGLRFSLKDLKELVGLINRENPTYTWYSNSASLFCQENFYSDTCRLLLTPFEELPLLAGSLSTKCNEYKIVYEWMLSKG